MHFDGHTKFCNPPPFCFIHGPLQEGVFYGLETILIFFYEMQDFGAQYLFVADSFEVGEALVDLSVPQVFSDSRLCVNFARDESATRVFVGLDCHDAFVVLECIDGSPLPRSEVGQGELFLVGKR